MGTARRALRHLKPALASGVHWAGADRLGLELQKRLRMPFVRALNYHDVPASQAAVFEQQLRFYARHFEPVDLESLLVLASGRWPHRRPGLLLSFDDGLASHFRVVAPLLEKHGFVGWFMVPPGFVDCPAAEQRSYAKEHSINVLDDAGPDGRVALSWDEIRGLAERGHVIGCHTHGHVRFSSGLSQEVLHHETMGARQRLEEEIGASVEVFCWVGGEEWSYSREGAESVRKAGFRIGLMTNNHIFRPGDDLLQVQRANVETSYSDGLTKLHLSGLYDVFYAPKRRRVESLTAVV